MAKFVVRKKGAFNKVIVDVNNRVDKRGFHKGFDVDVIVKKGFFSKAKHFSHFISNAYGKVTFVNYTTTPRIDRDGIVLRAILDRYPGDHSVSDADRFIIVDILDNLGYILS